MMVESTAASRMAFQELTRTEQRLTLEIFVETTRFPVWVPEIVVGDKHFTLPGLDAVIVEGEPPTHRKVPALVILRALPMSEMPNQIEVALTLRGMATLYHLREVCR